MTLQEAPQCHPQPFAPLKGKLSEGRGRVRPLRIVSDTAGAPSEGLPIAVQVIARPWREDVALAVARRIEEAFGGWQPPKV